MSKVGARSYKSKMAYTPRWVESGPDLDNLVSAQSVIERQVKRRGCCICGSARVFRIVGKQGFCGAHTDEAFLAARQRMRGTDGVAELGKLSRR